MIRQLIVQRPDVKVVLMSATLHAELFSAYFGDCPRLSIAGMTHPVQEFYLEHVLRKTGFVAAKTFTNTRAMASEGGPAPGIAEERELEPWLVDEANAVCARESVAVLTCTKTIQSAWHAADMAVVASKFDDIFHFIVDEKLPVDFEHSATRVTPLMLAAAKAVNHHQGRCVLICTAAGLRRHCRRAAQAGRRSKEGLLTGVVHGAAQRWCRWRTACRRRRSASASGPATRCGSSRTGRLDARRRRRWCAVPLMMQHPHTGQVVTKEDETLVQAYQATTADDDKARTAAQCGSTHCCTD